jgi:hypothetical protein
MPLVKLFPDDIVWRMEEHPLQRSYDEDPYTQWQDAMLSAPLKFLCRDTGAARVRQPQRLVSRRTQARDLANT